MNEFVLGALATLFAVAGAFFFRYWRETRDRLFAVFALAFAVLAFNQLAFAVVGEAEETSSYLYVVRLAAYVLLLLGILDRNTRE